ncbi:hypothetical protein NPIL_111411 [Nephila pilipes]|uniref:Uncharacterized protein n=1 Tax=Nephila pilipes TaxID=299642 RepID=A0A8X6N9C5_NEPPI|nr:hypothetical protein NPIL_111411 [Nephila pilipes]
MSWNVIHDYFTIDVKGLLELDTSKPVTKRIVLQSAGKIYDPVEFLSPYTIQLKCLLQELWLRKLAWDDELPPDIYATWLQWWFIHNCRTRSAKITGPLTSQEVSYAENWLIHSLHEKEFPEEMRKLLAGVGDGRPNIEPGKPEVTLVDSEREKLNFAERPSNLQSPVTGEEQISVHFFVTFKCADYYNIQNNLTTIAHNHESYETKDSTNIKQTSSLGHWDYSSLSTSNKTPIASASIIHTIFFSNKSGFASNKETLNKTIISPNTHQWSHEIQIPNRQKNRTSTDLFHQKNATTSLHDMRFPVLVESSHDLRKPTTIHETHDQRKPLIPNPQHDKRKPIIPQPDHDLRKPVDFEEAHDQRWPVLKKEYDY